MTRSIKTLTTLTAFIVSVMTLPVYATNGYFSHGLGTRSKAMAGAGTASPQQAIAVAANPAAALVVGEQTDIGLSIFSPRRSFKASSSMANGHGGAFTIGSGKVDSDREFFPIPYVAKIFAVTDERALALTFYGRGGMNTDYHGGSAIFDPDGPGPAPVTQSAGPFGDGPAGVDLAQAFIDLTYARRFKRLTWGVSAVAAMQVFEAKGLGSFAGFTRTFAASGGTALPRYLTDNGHDFSSGFGVSVGGIWDVNDAVSVALSYQSRIKMSDFDDYSDLFAESGGFDIPSSILAGISWQVNPTLQLDLDLEHTRYSEIDSVGNPLELVFSCPIAGAGGTRIETCLGGARGAGFGWDDMTTIKLGVEWRVASLSRYVFRAGYSHGNQPIGGREAVINILAPGVIEDHFTWGFTRSLREGDAFSLALMYAPARSIDGTNLFDPTQKIELEMHQFELEVGYHF